MKRNFKIPSLGCAFAAVAVVLLFVALPACTVVHTPPPNAYVSPPPPPAEYDDGYVEADDGYVNYVEYDDFEELSRYGDWIELPPYGVVWQPSVVRGWQPYFHGHWVWTEWEWMWVSYEPFGWATYHYGFWYYDPGWGWIWIPGNEWSPVRVQWVYFDDYVCWAPMPPPGYVVADPWIAHSPNLWVVVHFRNFTHRDLNRYTVTLPPSVREYKRDVFQRHAPTVRVVERYTGRQIRRVDVKTKDHRVGKKTYKQIVLPPEHRKTVESYKPQTRKKVFKPDVKSPPPKSEPPEYKTREKTKTKEPVKEKQKTREQQQKPTKTKSKTNKGKG